mgnify:CR=1 FL=1
MTSYQIVLADCPWSYYGSGTKDAAAAKHYTCIPDEEMLRLDVASYMAPRSLLLLWATCPRLDFAVKCIESWGLAYRGVAFVWVKTRQDGGVIGAQGPRASVTNATTELVLAASPRPRGRPLPIADESVAQVFAEFDVPDEPDPVFAPRGAHSEKPDEVYRRIEKMYPDATKCELFARRERAGWDCVGDQLSTPSRVRTR